MKLEEPAKRCGPPTASGEAVWFRASDGSWLEGATVGESDVGVVFVHEDPGPQAGPYCGFWPYAVELAHRGVRSLLFNLRCFGESSCPTARRGHPIADVRGAVAEVERLGARDVVLVGASLGGVVAVEAAAALRPPPAGLVDLSGELYLGRTLGGSDVLDAGRAAGRVVSPSLLIVSRQDRFTSVSDMRTVFRRIPTSQKRLVVARAGTGHGWTMLMEFEGGMTAIGRQVAAFVTDAGQ